MVHLDQTTPGQSHQRKTYLVLQILETLDKNSARKAVCTRWTQDVSYSSSWTQAVRAYRTAFETSKNALHTLYTLQGKTPENKEDRKESSCVSYKKMEPTTDSETLS